MPQVGFLSQSRGQSYQQGAWGAGDAHSKEPVPRGHASSWQLLPEVTHFHGVSLDILP